MAERKKTGGRDKGTPNKLTKEVKEVLSEIVSNELENIDKTLKTLSSKDRIEIVLKLLPFVIPKLRDTEINLTQIDELVLRPITKEELEDARKKIEIRI